MLRGVQLWWNRDSIEDTIFKSEITANASKIDAAEIMKRYASKIEEKKPFAANELRSIAKRLKANEKKFKVYADYLGSDMITLLTIAEQKSLSSGAILKEYAPIRKIALKNLRTIKSALTAPLLLFVFITTVLGFVISKFAIASTSIEFSFLSNLFIHHFMSINSTLLILLIIAFFIVPKKVPILSKAFTKLESLLAVSLITTMYSIGLSSQEVIPIVQKQFDLDIERGRGDLNELVRILGDCEYLSLYDMADIEMAMEYGKFNETLLEKRDEKTEEAERFGDLIGEIVKNFSLLIMAAPVLQFVIVILDLMAKTAARVG